MSDFIDWKPVDSVSMLSKITSKGTNVVNKGAIGARLAWKLLGPTVFAKYATTAALPTNTAAGAGVSKTLTGNLVGALATQDGISPTAGDIILVKDEAIQANNGLCSVTTLGDGSNPYVLTRITTFDQNTEIVRGIQIGVLRGTVNGLTQWYTDIPNRAPVVDTDSILFGRVTATSRLVRVATAAALSASVTQSGAGVGATLTNAGVQAALTVDGVALALSDRVLVKNITTGVTSANFGIYAVTTVGTGATNWVLTRSTDSDAVSEIPANTLMTVAEGSTLSGKQYLQTATLATMDTTAWVVAAGEPTGVWTVEASNNSTDGIDGNWDAITMTIATQPAGSSGATLLDLLLPWKYVRFVYTPSAGTGTANVHFVAGVR
jgi:hypothetical protein